MRNIVRFVGYRMFRWSRSTRSLTKMSQWRVVASAVLAYWGALMTMVLSSSPAAAFACTITATNIAFGSVNVLTGSPVSSTATLNLSCSGAPSNKYIRICVDIDGGTASDATSRMMKSGSTASLRYQLFSDSGGSTAWGSWTAGIFGGGYTWDVFSTSANVSASTTVYGTVSSGQQTAASGSYTSTLGLSLTYDNSNATACPFTGKGNSTTTFAATATVPASCQVSASNLNFGSTGSLTSPVDAATTVGVTCTNGSAYSVGLGVGTGTGATVSARKMTNGASTVTYSLYRDTGRTSLWGNTVGSDTASGTGTGVTQSFTVYGRVPSQTTPAVGSYSDTIVVTVTY